MDTTTRTRSRLAVMMFLEYVIWGSWLPLLALYLTDVLRFSGAEIGWVFATPAVACLVGLFVGGQVADRLISTERLLAICHVIGGTAMFALAWQRAFWPFLILMQVYQLAFIPTVALTNAVVFHNVPDARHDFGPLRMWGTIGWIAASWPFVFILAGKTGDSLHAALGNIFVVAGLARMDWPPSRSCCPGRLPARGPLATRPWPRSSCSPSRRCWCCLS
jgi:MFS family permease